MMAVIPVNASGRAAAMSRATPPISSASGIGSPPWSRAPSRIRAESSTARGWSTPREGRLPVRTATSWLLRLNTFARFSRVESKHIGEGLQRAGIAPSGPGVTRRQPAPRGASPKLILAAGAVLLSLSAATTVRATSPEVRSGQGGPVAAEFRGCTSAGWCRFWIRSWDPLERAPVRVYPDGVPRTFSDEVAATAVRDRMNALLASMIHQHKRIVLHGLREAGAGAYAAQVTVNDADLASDPVLLELRGQHRGRIP
jgi:hypothetical protein